MYPVSSERLAEVTQSYMQSRRTTLPLAPAWMQILDEVAPYGPL